MTWPRSPARPCIPRDSRHQPASIRTAGLADCCRRGIERDRLGYKTSSGFRLGVVVMRGAPKQLLTLLLSLALAAPAAAQTPRLDGDWEGTWRCEGADGAGASTSAAIATINGSRIKLSRAGDASDVVLSGTIDAAGGVVLSGRGTGPDGAAILASFAGTVSSRALTASGRALPVGPGPVQTCALALVPLAAPAGPTVLRGSAAPQAEPPAPAPSILPAPSDNPATATAAPFDNDVYWRYHRLQRWEQWRGARERRGHPPPPVCDSGQFVSPGNCRTGPPNAIGPTPPPRAQPPTGAPAPKSGSPGMRW